MSEEINFYGSLWKEILSKWIVGLEYNLGGLSGRGNPTPNAGECQHPEREEEDGINLGTKLRVGTDP